jgi:integrase/recombinase XerD
MSPLTNLLEEYLALRHALGYKLERASALLAEFVAYLEQAGAEHVTVELAVAWAMQTANPDSRWRAQRLSVVRCFARYLHGIDPRHQVPPAGLIYRGTGRPEPFLFRDSDVLALMTAARTLRSPLRAATVETLIGLLAVTGLRVGEAIRLDRADVDLEHGSLLVRSSKGGRSRPVPLAPSTVAALHGYLARRDELLPRPSSAALFVSCAGTRLRHGNLHTVFARLLQQAAVPARPGSPRPRLGTLRHTFAIQTLRDWHLAGEEIGPRLPALSTYLGHASPESTYWYLTGAAPLLNAAATRLAHHREARP